MQAEQIINTAFNNFRKLTGYSMNMSSPFEYERILRIPPKYPIDLNTPEIDGYIICNAGKKNIGFKAEIKNEIRQIHVIPLLKQIGNQKEEWLLISQYIPKPVKEDLRELGINYLEATGNCNIRKGELMIYINDQEVTRVRKTSTGKIWNKTGLKLVFALLINPELLNNTYRDISEKSGVALGTIGDFISELTNEGYIHEHKGELVLVNKERLIDKWAELYQVNLRPLLTRGRYTYYDSKSDHIKNRNYLAENWMGLINKKQEGKIFWGGEPAGAIITKRLIPEQYTIYSKYNDIYSTIIPLRLKDDPNGEIEILDAFWQSDSNEITVPPLLVYADLITTTDSRNHEIAEKIKSKYLL